MTCGLDVTLSTVISHYQEGLRISRWPAELVFFQEIVSPTRAFIAMYSYIYDVIRAQPLVYEPDKAV